MYFKIKVGYSPSDFIRIDNLRDLEKAQFAFLTNAKTIFENGAVCRGQDILSNGIREDWNREMGWNDTYRDDDGRVKAYELSEDDYSEIRSKGVDKKYAGVIAGAKEKVQFLIESGQANLIGKDAKIGPRPKEISDRAKSLADKFKI